MNKKSIFLTLSLLIIGTTSSYASESDSIKQSVVIIDTALSSNVLILQDRISHEVCILESGYCPNGETFMEGKGSAVLPDNILQHNGFDHGTIMATTFALNNKDTDIIFIRLVGSSPSGKRLYTSAMSFFNALDWVITNKDKFNIQAVAMSQNSSGFNSGSDYCLKFNAIENMIEKMYYMGVPLFVPTGNENSRKRISWPSCIDRSISIGAIDKNMRIASWSNVDVNKTDFYALGTFNAITLNNKKISISGTSISNQIAAANWMTIKNIYKDYSYDQIYKVLYDLSVKVYGKDMVFGQMINMSKVKK